MLEKSDQAIYHHQGSSFKVDVSFSEALKASTRLKEQFQTTGVSGKQALLPPMALLLFGRAGNLQFRAAPNLTYT